MDQPGTQQMALRVKEDGVRGVVYVVLCVACQAKYADTTLKNYKEVKEWLESGIIPPKDTKWW
jgi:hypothetical protein